MTNNNIKQNSLTLPFLLHSNWKKISSPSSLPPTEVIEKVDSQVREGLAGRLFAVVYLQGKQHLVTPGDLVVVQTPFPPNIGDAIRLEKVCVCVCVCSKKVVDQELQRKRMLNYTP